MSTENQEPVTPANHIDPNSADAQKWFSEAFASETGKDINTTTVVTPPEPEATAPTVEVKTEQPPKKEEVKVEPKLENQQAQKVEAATEKKEDAPTTQPSYGNLPDWAKDLPDAVKQNLSKELQEKLYYQQWKKSEEGRQASLQKLLLNTRRELADLRAKQNKPQEDSDLAAAAKADSAKTIAEWNALIEADPNLAKAIDLRTQQLIAAESAKVKAETQAQIQANVGPLLQHTEETYEQQQRRIVLDQIPNFDEVVSSPVYAYWVNRKASPGIKSLIYNSQEADDVMTVMQMYAQSAPSVYQEMVRAGMLPAQESPAQQRSTQVAQPQAPAPEVVAHADKVAQERANKVNSAPVVPASPAPVVPNAHGPISRVPGDKVDPHDAAVQALFAAEFKKNQVQRVR